MSNEYILAETGGQRNQLIIKLVPYEGHQLLDLRYWYRNANGELKPTRKGLSLTAGHFGVVMETLATYAAAIQAWLSGGSNVDLLLEEAEQQATTEAVKARQKATKMVRKESKAVKGRARAELMDEPRSRAFFSVDHRGGEERVLYNKHHPFTGLLMATESVDDVKDLVNDLLAAYRRARHAIEGEGEEGLLDLLEHEWAERVAARAAAQQAEKRST